MGIELLLGYKPWLKRELQPSFKLISEFKKRTGVIDDDEPLVELGFNPIHCTGIFMPKDLPLLQEFCLRNPEYHILSGFGISHEVNRVHPDAINYSLGDGDPDPKIELHLPKIWEDSLKFCLGDIFKNY